MAAMTAYFSSVLALGKRPSAFVPIAMSVAALLMVLASIAVSGVRASLTALSAAPWSAPAGATCQGAPACAARARTGWHRCGTR